MKLPGDIDKTIFGETLVNIFNQYGFGTLGKVDLEAALLYALLQSSNSMHAADSYARADMLRITDVKYRSLSLRAGIWLSTDKDDQDDVKLYQDFLKRAVQEYIETPEEKEVKILIDDELERRNIQRALERPQHAGVSVPVEMSLTRRCLILRGIDLDRMIDRLNPERCPPDLKDALTTKKGVDRRKAVLSGLKKGGAKLVDTVLPYLIGLVTMP